MTALFEYLDLIALLEYINLLNRALHGASWGPFQTGAQGKMPQLLPLLPCGRPCWLVVKEGLLQRANHVFMGTGVQVTSSGHPYLGAALGSTTFIDLFTEQRVDEWIQGVSRLPSFAETQPHASYAAFAHGYLSKWNYYFLTTPNISNRFSPLESAVRSHFLPKLVLYPVGDVERELFGLAVRFGGLSISNPTLTSDEQYTFSRELLHGLIDLIYHQNPALSEDVVHHQHEIFRHLYSVRAILI